MSLNSFEKRFIQIVCDCDLNICKAAKVMGINRNWAISTRKMILEETECDVTSVSGMVTLLTLYLNQEIHYDDVDISNLSDLEKTFVFEYANCDMNASQTMWNMGHGSHAHAAYIINRILDKTGFDIRIFYDLLSVRESLLRQGGNGLWMK